MASRDSELQVSVRLLHPFRAVLQEEGVPFEPLLTEVGLSPAVFGDLDARIAGEQAVRFMRCAQAATRLPALGLRAARHYDAAQLHVLEYLAASSADGEAALEGLVRHQHVLSDARRLSLERRPEGMLIRYDPPPRASRAVLEYVIGGLALAVWRVSGGSSKPRGEGPVSHTAQVWFAFPEPADAESYRAFFKIRVVFDAPVTGLLIDARKLKRPMLRANPRLEALMERHVEDMEQRSGATTLSLRLRRLLASELAGTPMGQSEAARRLHMSTSTLKRRLAEEGTTYRDVLDALRHQTARRLLKDSPSSVGEIACLLGYQDIAAFSRAFRRWSGETPSRFRQRAAS